MSIAHETTTAPEPDQPEACPPFALGQRVERRLTLLDQLAELAMAAAVVAQRRIIEQDERERGAAPDPTGARDQIAKRFQLDFARAAQALRQTLALQEKIEQDYLARTDRAAAAAAARRAEAAERRAAERQANIERRRNRVQHELARVIKAKAAPQDVADLIVNMHAWLRPEHLDTDFGDAPLHEIFLRICRNLGVPESWSRQWDQEPHPEDAKSPGSPAPIRAAGPAETAGPREAEPPPQQRQSAAMPAKTDGPKKAEAAPQRRQSAPLPPWAMPHNHPARAAATALALCLAAPGTGPPR